MPNAEAKQGNGAEQAPTAKKQTHFTSTSTPVARRPPLPSLFLPPSIAHPSLSLANSPKKQPKKPTDNDIPHPPQTPLPTHTHTVVFLHGRGDNTRAFSAFITRWRDSMGRNLLDTFPTVRWVFPQAPQRPIAAAAAAAAAAGGQTATQQHCPQWFDVWNVRDFADREALQAPGLRDSVLRVRDLLRDEAARLGGDWTRLVLAGISMGAATGVHTLFNLTVPSSVDGGGGGRGGGGGGGRLGGLMGFCARCPFAGRGLDGMREVLGLEGVPPHDEVVRRTPMMLAHCANDPLVLVEKGRGLRDTLRAFGAQVEWCEYADGGHWFHEPEGLDDVVRFLEGVVGVKSVDALAQIPADARAMDLS
ncbi:alpha/beta-hydrolase [Trichocladium antarcticum]|uniref:Alpha/beta-hydrolase n=1 Tax=Trichocladium antarcticum TaxID=1450529 RepID=A0AAN6ZAY2_9PEZI|nr:alpha/beta-hydrolase [Trichocladium antarcticum]